MNGESLRLRFKGKSGKEHDITLDDRAPRADRPPLPGPAGPRAVPVRDEDGEVRSVDVRATSTRTCSEVTGGDDFTAKDFRTWNATVIAANALACAPVPVNAREATRTVNDAIRAAAAALGNTLAVCRKSYVHPDVLDCARAAAAARRKARPPRGLYEEEARVLAMLDVAAREARRRGDLAGALAATLKERAPRGRAKRTPGRADATAG